MIDHRLDEQDVAALRSRFERLDDRLHPRPRPATSRWVRVALTAIVLASVIVSASHTIPTFLSDLTGDQVGVGQVIVALSTLTMIECGMLALSYLRTRMLGREDRRSVVRNVGRGLTLIFVLALGANLHTVLAPRFSDLPVWGVFSLGVYVLVGISAPALAYITGEVLGTLTVIEDRDNQDAVRQWSDGREGRWKDTLDKYTRHVVRGQRVTVDRDHVPSIPTVTSTVPELPAGEMSQVDKAEQWIRDNPDKADWGSRRIGVLIGVGKDSVIAAKDRIRGDGQS